MPKATILVTTTPGGGPAVVEALAGDARAPRCFATHGPHEAVAAIDCATHADLLEVIQKINQVEAQVASETLMDMAVEEEADGVSGTAQGAHRALLLVMESKDQACHYAHTLFSRLIRIAGVEEAYPLLGRIDDAVWIRYQDAADLTRVVRAVQAEEGVREVQVLVEAVAPSAPIGN